MTPSWWQFTLLALAAYRLTRLVGWDDFPLAIRLRTWAVRGEWVAGGEQGAWVFGRPTVAKLITCPFCVGWWICLATFGLWLLWPQAMLVAAVPFSLSAVVGLIAKNLDA